MPTTPSYYLENLARKRKRSDDLRGGLADATATGMQGLDTLSRLTAALEGKEKAAEALEFGRAKDAEALDHGRGIEDANQARADKRFEWEGEDRKNKEIDRQAALAAKLAEDEDEAEAMARHADFSGDAVTAREEAKEAGEVEAQYANQGDMTDALEGLRARVESEGINDAPIWNVDDDKKRAETELLRAKAKREGERGKGGPKAVDPVKEATAADKARKAKADADKAERDLAKGAAGEPMSESEVGKLAKGDSLIKDIESLEPIAAKQPMGVGGWLQRRIPDWASSLKSDQQTEFDQMNGFVMKQIAKGIEEGAITPGEQEQYNAMLANSSGSPTAYMASLKRILGIMKQRQADKRAALEQSNYNVPGATGNERRGAETPAAAEVPPWRR